MSELHLPLDRLPSNINRLLIAFSAGIDSCFLLHRLVQQKLPHEIVIWHINHGLQENAAEMESMSYQMGKLYQCRVRVDHLDLDPASSNLEAQARNARYELFSQELSADDALLTAHHQDDQAETLLLNLARGSGAKGLRGIAQLKPLGQGHLFRPMLHLSRSQIERYARHQGLNWVEDPSNAQETFDRNFLRHRVMPVLKSRWPKIIQQMARASRWQTEQQQLIQALAKIDLKQIGFDSRFSSHLCLNVSQLRELAPARVRNLIRFWLQSEGMRPLSYKRLQQLMGQLQHSAEDKQPLIEGEGYSLRRFKQKLYLLETSEPPVLQSEYCLDDNNVLVIAELELSINRIAILDYLGVKDNGQEILIRFRGGQGGEGQTAFPHRLKRLFQSYQVPPWLRDQLPQLYLDGELKDLWLPHDSDQNLF